MNAQKYSARSGKDWMGGIIFKIVPISLAYRGLSTARAIARGSKESTLSRAELAEGATCRRASVIARMRLC
jgi:hypothetical protein